MMCLDCAARGSDVAAIGVCAGCGAAVCLDHAVLSPRTLTCTAGGGTVPRRRPAAVAARTLRCRMCAGAGAARDACERGQRPHACA